MMHCPPVWLPLLCAWQGSDLCNLSHFVGVSSFKKPKRVFWEINSAWHFSFFWAHFICYLLFIVAAFLLHPESSGYQPIYWLPSFWWVIVWKKTLLPCCIYHLPSIRVRELSKTPSEVDGSAHWIIPLQSHLSAIFPVCQLSIIQAWPRNILGASSSLLI